MSKQNRHFYEFNPFRLDVENRLLLCNGEPLELMPKTFDTLLLLIEHRGQVLGKDQMMSALWPDTIVEEANLSQNIYLLRKTLEQHSNESEYIKTIPKRGYRFVGEVKELWEAEAELQVERHTLSRLVIEEETSDGSVVVPTSGAPTRDAPAGGLGFAAQAERAKAPTVSAGETVALSTRQAMVETANQPADPISYEPAPVTTLSIKYLSAQIKEHRAGAGLAVAALVMAVAAIIYFGRSEKAKHSLVVLPLENASADANKDYMSDGITESLINSLSQLPQLKVIPRTTAFRYKGQQVDPQKAGRDLGVDAVLTGRVTQQGEDLIVQTELINVADGTQFWGERYDRKQADIFSLQGEIAKEITERLRLKLTGEEEQRLTKRYTENPAAYELYLKGRYHLNKLTPPEVQTSVSYFQQAVALDPSYALAYVGLADAYRAFALTVGMPATEFFPKAKAAAQKAIELDDRLAEAHAGLGFAIQFYDWDWSAAETQYRQALQLNPNSADTHFSYASLFAVTGRHAEALAEIKRARELDPLNLRTNTLEGQLLIVAGQTDEGLAQLQKTIELEPNFFLPHLFASSAYIKKGMYGEAIAEATKARDLAGGNSEVIAMMGYALAMSGKRDEARAVLDELKKRSTERYIPPYDFALVYNGLGERDEVFAWLKRGVEQREPKILFLSGDLRWDNLRDDPRFQDLLRRVGLPQ